MFQDYTRKHILNSENVFRGFPEIPFSSLRLSDLIKKAEELFVKNDVIELPPFKEMYTENQIEFLSIHGAPMVLYYLGLIENVYKTISRKNADKVSDNIDLSLGIHHEKNKPWLFDFRHKKLKLEVNRFLRKNPQFDGQIFIVYGGKS